MNFYGRLGKYVRICVHVCEYVRICVKMCELVEVYSIKEGAMINSGDRSKWPQTWRMFLAEI